MKHSPAIRKPVRRVNRKRKASEFKRCYGSKERVEFVKSLPCAACGAVGYSVNAHLTPKGEKGTGYKGHYRFIAPLCENYSSSAVVRAFCSTLDIGVGCHKLYDNYREEFDERFPDFNPENAAGQTEQAWLSTQHQRTK